MKIDYKRPAIAGAIEVVKDHLLLSSQRKVSVLFGTFRVRLSLKR
jgi:hypothetical protein